MKREVQKTQDEIYRRKQLLDPAPELPFSGDFKLFFDSESQERLGMDDRKVLTTALKNKYNGQTDKLMCYCTMCHTARRFVCT